MSVTKLLATTLALVACATPAILTPPTGFPCGYHGISCGNHMCCDENEVCGTPNQGVNGNPYSGCAEGYCCWQGPTELGVSLVPKHQYPESR